MAAERVKVPSHVLVRPVQGELVLLNLESEEYYGLDEVGCKMWDALTTTDSTSDAMEQLLTQFEVDEATLASDLATLISALASRGLVVVEQ